MKFLYTIMLYITLLVIILSNRAYAQSSSLNLAIPQSPQSFQSDRVRAGDVECSAAIGSSTNVEFGVVGLLNQNDPFTNNNPMAFSDPAFNPYSNQFIRDVGVYGRITIPIGAPKERLNCNELYKLELEKKRLEVYKLRQEIQQLRAMKFEN